MAVLKTVMKGGNGLERGWNRGKDGGRSACTTSRQEAMGQRGGGQGQSELRMG